MSYVEDETLNLDPSENGVVTIGDLWNCNESASVGYNLFGPLTEEHIIAYPIQDAQYDLSQVKSFHDKYKILGASIGFEIPVEPFLIIVLGGGVEFEARDGKILGEDEMICTCRKDNFAVKTTKAIHNNISQSIRAKIESGTLRATHVVTELITGARLNAVINIKDEGPKKRLYLKGSAKGTANLYVASATIGASLWVDDTSIGLETITDITVTSTPPVKTQPKNMAELLTMVKSFNADDEFPFQSILGKDVSGVPVKFRAVPIQQFLKDHDKSLTIPMEKFYKVVDRDLLESLLLMVTTLKDIQVYQYIKVRVLERDSRLEHILKDSENQLTINISEQENELKILAVQFQTKAYRITVDYRLGRADATDLRELLKDFEEQFNFCKIHADVLTYAAEGRQQLLGVQALDYIEEESDLTFFTNLPDLQDWLESSITLKILLQTKANEDSQESHGHGAILTLFEMSKALKEIGIETGILYPNVSTEFSIQFTSNGTTLDSGKKFLGNEVIFALRILRVAIGNGRPVETRFHSVIAALNSINLPLKPENLNDIKSLISTTMNFQDIKVFESFLQLRETISKDLKKWKFVLSVDVADTLVEGVTCFKRLKAYLEQRLPQLDYELIVGTFGSHITQQQFSEAPVLLIFHDNNLKAVCLDNLDLQMLLQKFLTARNGEDPDLSSFSLKNFTEICLYPERCRFSVAVANLWGDRESSLKIFSHGSFRINVHPVIPLTIELVRAAVSGDNNQIVASGAKICLTHSNDKIFPDLLNILKKHKWDDAKQAFLVDIDVKENATMNWRSLHLDLNNYYYTNDTFLSKLDLAITTLQEYSSEKDTYDSIQKLIDYQECPLDLRVELEKVLAEDLDETARQTKLIEKMVPFIEKLQGEIKFTNVHGEETEDHIAKYNMVLMKLEECVAEMKRRLNSLKANPKQIIDDVLNSEFKDESFKLEEAMASYDKNKHFEVYVKGALKVFDACRGKITSQPRFQHLKALIDFTNQLGAELPTTTPEFLADIITRYILALNELLYPGTWPKVVSFVKRQSFYQALDTLRKSISHPALKTVFDNLDTLCGLPDEDLLIRIIKNLGDYKLNANNYRDLWENPKFLHLMEYGVRFPNFLNSIKQFQCQADYDINFVPDFIPPDFAQEIKALVVADSITFEWKRVWDDLLDFLQVLQIILIRGRLPKDFQRVLWNNIRSNNKLKERLHNAGVLYFWNEAEGYFNEAWDFSAVSRATSGIKEWIKKDKDSSAIVTEIDIPIQEEELEEEDSIGDSKIIELNPQWYKLTGGSLKLLDNSTLFQFIDTLHKPKVSDDEMTTFMGQVIPYVFQELQLLDISALTPKNISECVEKLRDQFETERPGNIHLDSDDDDEENPPVSRLDVLTCILNSMETDMGLWLLQTLNRFPSPLPLIVPNITYNPTKKFKCLLPWLKQLTSTEKKSSALFTDPHRLIVCCRIGDTTLKERPGKSQILNSILKPENIFSSRNEPGSETGKPWSLPGFVEFIELSPYSCNENIWNALNSENPSGNPILLANVHGDILNHPETLSLLSGIASSFLVFHMPANWSKVKESTKQLQNIIKYPKSKDILHVFIDPIGEVFDNIKPSDLIKSEDLGLPYEENEKYSIAMEKLKNLLLTCMKIDPVSSKSVLDIEDAYESIEIVENMETSLSTKIINYCTSSSCKIVKDALSLHDQAPLAINDFNRIWQDNSDLREYISLFVSITKLPAPRRRIAFMHLSQRLSQLAFGETQVLRRIAEALIPHLEKEIEAEGSSYNKESVINLQRYLKEIHSRQQHDRLITIQDFFNELIAIYELPFHSASNEETISAWPKAFADFFDDGNPIELSCHKNAKWMDDFLLHLKEKHSDLKIFVVSIIGSENSGKSRLLNDLFGTKFMTRPLARSNGITVSLVHLQEISKTELQNDIDALLVIDTEGLCPLETLGNTEAETEQKEMVGQVISLSNLVIFNATGKARGTIDFLQNILELPLLTLSRLGNGGFLENTISLDITTLPKEILLVHNVDDSDTTSLELNVRELCLVFEATAKYSNENDLEIGRNHMLDNIFTTIIGKEVDPETIGCRLRPLETNDLQSVDGIPYFEDIDEIKQRIVTIVKKAENTPTIVDWFHSSQIIQDWFTNIHFTNSNFPCNLNSIAELKTYSEIRAGIMNEFKNAVDAALESHRSKMEKEIENIAEWAHRGVPDKVQELDILVQRAEYVLSSCDLEGRSGILNGEDDGKDTTVKYACSLCKTAMLLSSSVEIHSKIVPASTGIEQSVKFYIQRKCDYLRQYICQKIASAKLKFGIPWEFKPDLIAKMKLMMSDPDEFGEKPEVLKDCWYFLQQLVATEGVQLISLLRMVVADVEEEYKHSHHLAAPPILKSKLLTIQNGIFDSDEKPVLSLDWEHDQWLHSQLQGMLSLIFKESEEANIFRVGMARKLKEKIDDSIEQFQIRHKSQLNSEDKWKVHSRGLVLFYQQALSSEKFGINPWNNSSENNPVYCLRNFADLNVYKELDELFEDIGRGLYSE